MIKEEHIEAMKHREANIIIGIGASTSAIIGANIVISLDTRLQTPKAVEQYTTGKRLGIPK